MEASVALVPVSNGLERIEVQSASIFERIEALVVNSEETVAIAMEIVNGATDLINAIKGELKEPKAKAKAAHESLCELEKRLIATPQMVVTLGKQKALAWQQAERKRAEDERRRIDDERRAEERRRMELADWAEEQGDKQYAEQVRATAVILPAEPPKKVAPVASVPTRKEWKATVTDPFALLCWVATRPEHANLFTVNQTNANALARLIKNTAEIPGLKLEEIETVVSGRK